MAQRTVNLALLVLIPIEVLSGFASFLAGTPEGRWVFWLHAAGGLTLAILIPWKATIALQSFAHRGLGPWAGMPLALTVIFLAALLSGLLWSAVGLPRVSIPHFGRVTGLTLHVALGSAVLPFLALHAALRWFRPRRVDFASRRNALGLLSTIAAGAVLWRGTETAITAASLPGASRRFTGSREEGSFRGNAHPVTNWLFDKTQHIERETWRLHVHGFVEPELMLGYEEIAGDTLVGERALLDCTGGWYSVQDWAGVRVADLLAAADVAGSARSILVVSATGFSRRFSLADAERLLLALTVGGEPISAVHGFPARLVAPGWRGYNWVKWVTEIEVSSASHLWQPPLPLQ